MDMPRRRSAPSIPRSDAKVKRFQAITRARVPAFAPSSEQAGKRTSTIAASAPMELSLFASD
jgi:hypothetical protein